MKYKHWSELSKNFLLISQNFEDQAKYVWFKCFLVETNDQTLLSLVLIEEHFIIAWINKDENQARA